MATYTSNLSLKKPAQSDKIRIADLNGNADNIDAAIGADFGQSSKPSINAAINSLADGLAIVAQGDVHAAISAGQFVYVRNHSTLAEGLYVANAAISANAALSGTNLTADTSGGLNALNSKIGNVIKYEDTNFMYLNDLTWTQTAGGEYAAEIPLPTGVTISGTVIGIMIQRIQSIATDYHVMPFSSQGVPSVMASKNTFSSGTRMQFRILYIPS